MPGDLAIMIVATGATATWGIWMALFPVSFVRFFARFPWSLNSATDVLSKTAQLRSRVVGCLVLGLAAALTALIVHVLTT